MFTRGIPDAPSEALLPASLSSRDLYNLAQRDARAWAAIAVHPNAYPDLLDWLERVGPAQVKETVAKRKKEQAAKRPVVKVPAPSLEGALTASSADGDVRPSEGEIADDFPADATEGGAPDDATVLAERSKAKIPLALLQWGDGTPTLIVSEDVLIGRRISDEVRSDDIQVVEVKDETRTVSAEHARLQRIDGQWLIEDLNSTNGIYLVHGSGAETEAVGQVAVTTEFYLGDVLFHLEPIG